VGDLSLLDKTWPIVGQLPFWRREEWPMPPFVRRDELAKRAWRVQYADNDANRVVAEEPLNCPNISELERDAVLGAGSAEIVMTRMLAEAAS